MRQWDNAPCYDSLIGSTPDPQHEGNQTMLHPSILRHYMFNRTECQSCPVDACADTAHFWGVRVRTLSAFLRTIGIDADHLRNL
jgi:hypothetical protein